MIGHNKRMRILARKRVNTTPQLNHFLCSGPITHRQAYSILISSRRPRFIGVFWVLPANLVRPIAFRFTEVIAPAIDNAVLFPIQKMTYRKFLQVSRLVFWLRY